MRYAKQMRLAGYYYRKGYITEATAESFKYNGNKGILGECRLAEILKIKDYKFDNEPGYDMKYRGLRIQFKFNGSGSSASATELRRKISENFTQHADRILAHYQQVDEFWIVTTNNLEFTKNDIHYYNRKEFKQLLVNHKCEINQKIRLQKGIIEELNKTLY